MAIVFGSYEANEIRRSDIANGVLSDCKDYGGTAPARNATPGANGLNMPMTRTVGLSIAAA